MRIVEYKPEHIELIKPVEPLVLNNTDGLIIQYVKRGPVFSLVDGGKILAIGGACLAAWQGIAEAWAFVSRDAAEKPVSVVRAFRRGIEMIEDVAKLRRLQATVRSDWKQSHKWLRALGFEFEGRLRAYGPEGHDHDMYSRVKNGN